MRSDSTTNTRPKESDAPILPLAQSLRLAVMRLARRLRQQSEPDMTPSMLSALSTIERHGPMTLRELAVHERVQPPTVTTVLEAALWMVKFLLSELPSWLGSPPKVADAL